jgi:DUF971 family protein
VATVDQLTPTQIGQSDERHLRIVWADGHASDLDVVTLRRKCPCAACIDEWSGRPRLDPASVTESVRPRSVRSVGLYALSIAFDDGHDSGIYPFELLRGLCPCGACGRP